MNKILNIFNIILFILFFSLLLILALYLQNFYLESFTYCNTYEGNDINTITDYFRISEDSSLNNSESRLHSDRSSSSFSFNSEDVHCFNFINKYKEVSSIWFNKLKNNLNNNAKHAAHKIKVLDRTLSWFFKGSKPGGGRGL
jgi:hypothetical protein